MMREWARFIEALTDPKTYLLALFAALSYVDSALSPSNTTQLIGFLAAKFSTLYFLTFLTTRNNPAHLSFGRLLTNVRLL